MSPSRLQGSDCFVRRAGKAKMTRPGYKVSKAQGWTKKYLEKRWQKPRNCQQMPEQPKKILKSHPNFVSTVLVMWTRLPRKTKRVTGQAVTSAAARPALSAIPLATCGVPGCRSPSRLPPFPLTGLGRRLRRREGTHWHGIRAFHSLPPPLCRAEPGRWTHFLPCGPCNPVFPQDCPAQHIMLLVILLIGQAHTNFVLWKQCMWPYN